MYYTVNNSSAQAYEEGTVGAENLHFTDMHEKTRRIREVE